MNDSQQSDINALCYIRYIILFDIYIYIYHIFVLSNILSNQMRYICNLVDSTQYALVRLGPAALNLYSTLRIFGL